MSTLNTEIKQDDYNVSYGKNKTDIKTKLIYRQIGIEIILHDQRNIDTLITDCITVL